MSNVAKKKKKQKIDYDKLFQVDLKYLVNLFSPLSSVSLLLYQFTTSCICQLIYPISPSSIRDALFLALVTFGQIKVRSSPAWVKFGL